MRSAKKSQSALITWFGAFFVIFFIMALFIFGTAGIVKTKVFSKQQIGGKINFQEGPDFAEMNSDLNFILNSRIFDNAIQKYSSVEEMIVRWDNSDGTEKELLQNEIIQGVRDILANEKIDGRFSVRKADAYEPVFSAGNNFFTGDKVSFPIVSKNKIYAELQR